MTCPSVPLGMEPTAAQSMCGNVNTTYRTVMKPVSQVSSDWSLMIVW